MKTFRDAALELDAIRADFARGVDVNTLKQRVDEVGHWLATKKKWTALVYKLLHECHQLHDKLCGGSGKFGTRLEIQ